MLEYIFFDERPWQRFIDFLRAENLDPVVSQGDEGWLVALTEEIDDDLDARIEAFYDEMLDYNQTLVAAEEGEAHVQTAGINLTLQDGRRVQAVVDTGLLQRLLQAVTAEELGEFVNAIVDAVENPRQRPICQR